MNSFFKSVDIRHVCLVLICFLWSGVLVIRAMAGDQYVRPPGTCPHYDAPYTSWDKAATNIQYAIDAAVDDETVHVTNGSYCITNQITITTRIIVKSVNGYTNTFVYADWPAYTTRCFYVVNTGTLDGFTVSNGHFYGSNDYLGGGGAYVATNGIIQNCFFGNNVCSNSGKYSGGGGVYAGSNAVISNCIFVLNKVYQPSGGSTIIFGGGVHGRYCSKIIDSTIISNYAVNGGGGVYMQGKNTIISNCFIADNSGSPGAGAVMETPGQLLVDSVISNNSSSGSAAGIFNYANVLNCLIINNRAGSTAGGIWLHSSTANSVSNCVIIGNSATTYGGGILMGSVSYNNRVSGCRISHNRAGGGGGGIYITNSGQVINSLICNNTNTSVTANGGGILMGRSAVNLTLNYGVINCMIVDNYSANEGGGVATLDVSNYVANCVIANNRAAGTYPDIYNTGDNSNSFWYCCATNVFFTPNQHNMTDDPRFVNASAGNWRLANNSPCINTGTNQSWMTNSVDLGGRTRIRYGIVDMGAYENIYEGTIYTVH